MARGTWRMGRGAWGVGRGAWGVAGTVNDAAQPNSIGVSCGASATLDTVRTLPDPLVAMVMMHMYRVPTVC